MPVAQTNGQAVGASPSMLYSTVLADPVADRWQRTGRERGWDQAARRDGDRSRRGGNARHQRSGVARSGSTALATE